MSLLWSENSEYRFPKPAKQEKRKKLSPLAYEKLRAQVYEEQNGNCLRCGRHLDTLPEMTLHHIKHSKAGGGSRNDRRENVEGLCWDPCHKSLHPGLQWGICKP